MLHFKNFALIKEICGRSLTAKVIQTACSMILSRFPGSEIRLVNSDGRCIFIGSTDMHTVETNTKSDEAEMEHRA